jgi:hypothetical protein
VKCINKGLEEWRGLLVVFGVDLERLNCRSVCLYFEIFSWVQRSTLLLGAQGEGIKRKRER